MTKLAQKNGLKVIYGLENSGAYGRIIKEVLTSRSEEKDEVNPLKTNRQKDFYGGDKSDEIDARCITQILLHSYENLPKIEEDNQVYACIREAERFRDTLVKTKTQNLNQLIGMVKSLLAYQQEPHLYLSLVINNVYSRHSL